MAPAPAPRTTPGCTHLNVLTRPWHSRSGLSRCGSFSRVRRFPTHGKFVNFDEIGLGWKPFRKYVPLYIPTTSRTGLRLAGKIGDGVVLNATCSPEYTVNALEIIKETAEEAGKDWSKFEVAQLINCSVEDDHQKALDEIRWEIATKFDPIQLPFNAGPRMRVGEPHIQKEDIPMFEETYRKSGMESLLKAIPDSYVEGMTASGTPEEVVKRVQQYCDAGVKFPVLRPAAMHQALRLLDLFANLETSGAVPYFLLRNQEG